MLICGILATGGGRALAKETGIPFLGAVPLDPRIGLACDYGENFFESYMDSPAYRAMKEVVTNLGVQLGIEGAQDLLTE